jgi:hypothetical protein
MKEFQETSEGRGMDTAILIEAKDSFEGVDAEYDYLEERFGPLGEGWDVQAQTLKPGEDGRQYDIMTVQFEDGKAMDIYFDISSFYGK